MPYTVNPIAGSATPGVALPGLANNQAGAVGSSTQASNVIRSIYDLDPYAILTNVYVRHDNQPIASFRFILEALGMGRGVQAPTTGHYEESRLEPLVKVGAIVTASTGVGTVVVLGLHADMMYTYNPAQNANGTQIRASRPRVGDIILFGGDKRAIVTAKNTTTNPHQITVKPLKSTVDLVGSTVVNSEYAIISNAWGEGTGLPDGILPRLMKYTNTFQIVKERFGATGTAGTDVLFAEFTRTSDNSIFGVLNRDAMDRFERSVSGALLWGQQINNQSAFNPNLGIDTPVSGTEGLIDFIDSSGHFPSFTIGSFAMADFDNASKIMVQEGVNASMLLTLQGYNIYQEVENLLFNYTLQNVAPLLKPYATEIGVPDESWTPFEDQNFNFYVGFKCVHKGGFNYVFHHMPEFTDPTQAGGATYKWASSQIIAPIGKTKDAVSGDKNPLWWYEWRQNKNYSRRASFGKFAGIGMSDFQDFGPAVNENDLATAGMLAEVAFHAACGNKMITMRGN